MRESEPWERLDERETAVEPVLGVHAATKLNLSDLMGAKAADEGAVGRGVILKRESSNS